MTQISDEIRMLKISQGCCHSYLKPPVKKKIVREGAGRRKGRKRAVSWSGLDHVIERGNDLEGARLQ